MPGAWYFVAVHSNVVLHIIEHAFASLCRIPGIWKGCLNVFQVYTKFLLAHRTYLHRATSWSRIPVRGSCTIRIIGAPV